MLAFLGCKPISTLKLLASKLSTDQGSTYSDPKAHRRLIGRLISLTNTGPDLSCAVNTLSQLLANPMHHILKYIKGCPGKGFFFTVSFDL